MSTVFDEIVSEEKRKITSAEKPQSAIHCISAFSDSDVLK